MNIQRLLIAIVAVYLLLWGLAVLFYDILLADQFGPMRALMRPEHELSGNMPWEMLAGLVQVAVFCYVFTKGREGGGIAEGVRYGFLIGLLLAAVQFVWTLSLPLSLVTAALVGIVALVMWTVAGAVLAAIYRPAEARGTG